MHRLHQPWPALEDWATGIDLDSLDDAAHAHVPYGEPPTHLNNLLGALVLKADATSSTDVKRSIC